MVVVAEVVTGMVVVAEVATGMVVVAEVVTGMVVVAEVLVARVVVAGVEDAISPASSPLNSIRSVCPCKIIFRLLQPIFLLR